MSRHVPDTTTSLTQSHRGIFRKHIYNLLLLAEKSVALQGLVELTLRDVGEDLILSFICCAVRDSAGKKETEGNVKQTGTGSGRQANILYVVIRLHVNLDQNFVLICINTSTCWFIPTAGRGEANELRVASMRSCDFTLECFILSDRDWFGMQTLMYRWGL